MTRNPIPYTLVVWLASGLVRVLLGSSTLPIAYFFFSLFWLTSAILLIAAIRQFVISKREQRIEAISIFAGLVFLFLQGLLGDGDTLSIAVLVFLASAVVLVFDPTGELEFSIPNPIAPLESAAQDAASQVGKWVSDAPGVISSAWNAADDYVFSCLGNGAWGAAGGAALGAAGAGAVPGAIAGGLAGCGTGLAEQGLRDADQDTAADAVDVVTAAKDARKAGKVVGKEAPELGIDLRKYGMSSFKEVVLRPVKYRLGFIIVFAAAALIAALITGSSIVAAVVAVGAVGVLGLIWNRRSRRPKYEDISSDRRAGAPYSVSYRWRTHQKPDLADLCQVLIRHGLIGTVESQASNEVVLRGGSQLWTRLLGGYFVNPRRLPIRVALETEDAGHEEFIVELGVRDRLGVGIRDGALKDRYMRAMTGIRHVIGDQLSPLGGREIDSGTTTHS